MGLKTRTVSLGLLVLSGATLARGAIADCGVDVYGASTRIGGEAGYPDIFTPASATVVVRTRTELVTAIANAQPGDVIYVADDAEIDLVPAGLPVSQWTIPIDVPDLVIASGRGRAGGAGGLLYVDLTDTSTTDDPARLSWPPFFHVTQPNVRFTGLRFNGNDTVVGPSMYNPPVTDGIYVDGIGAIELDNCQLWGFSHGALFIEGAFGDVHHNHIHHNRRNGLGYGVVLSGPASAIIESNILDHNRHDVAGTGHALQSYEARYNLVVGEGTNHSFDMHGEGERSDSPSGFAGHDIVVEFNTFLDDGLTAVKVRGAPHGFGHFNNNWFTHAVAAGQAIRQTFQARPWSPGASGTTADDPLPFPPGAFPSDDFMRMEQSNNCSDSVGWFRYEPKYQGFYPLARSSLGASSLAFGDFNADGRADVFRAGAGVWQVSFSGFSDWTTLTTSTFTLSELALGNFVGDSRTDVFRASGSGWFVSDAGTGPWQQLAASAATLSQLAFGNFVGDDRTDVLRANGSAWQVSDAGQGSWQAINNSPLSLSSLAFGNFVGDDRTDVFRATGTAWFVSDGGAGAWQQLASSSSTVPQLLFGNFVGDSRTDVLRASGGDWLVSDNAQSSWQLYARFGHGSYPVSGIRTADFTGDGKSDVFYSGKP